jgi:3-hydroxybutyryl-CoA dehydrogenase
MSESNSVIGIAGAGAMGTGIAHVASSAGHRVIVFDIEPAMLEKARRNLASTLEKLVERKKITGEESASVSERISWTSEMASLSPCSFVIEAIVENPEIKKQLFRKIEPLLSENAVLATNTSSLSIASLASSCERPQNFLGIHFFNPATLMPLVEIVPGIATSQKIMNDSKALIDRWGKTTVIAKDTPGFIVNRIARPFYSEALRIYEEGIADVSTIDHAMKEIGGFKMGPFELMDMIGHDVNYVVTETVWTQLYYDPMFKPAISQKRLLEAGMLGKKTGRGFYDYSGNVKTNAPNADKESQQKIFMRILCMLINAAADALYLNIASREDIDLAVTKGVNYPKGLLKWADEVGIGTVVKELSTLRAFYDEDRYRISPLLKLYAGLKRNFY